MQPALVIAALALATIMMSSHMELGSAGRERARNLGEYANSLLQAALNDSSTDPALAQAFLVLTLFELCPHPGHSPQRANDHVLFLDRLIRSQQLTFVDADDPEVSRFAPKAVPIVQDRRMYDPPKKCSCPRSPLDDPVAHALLPSWASVPPWEPSWNPAEVEKEECRRLCWSALSIISCQSVTSSAFDKDPPDFFLSDPANFTILFPGEVSLRAHPMDDAAVLPKESVWALHCRSMLLWNSCIRQKNEGLGEKEKAEFAIEAWRESQAIQDSLEIHVCSSNTVLSHSCREYLYNTRMYITTEFRRLQGVDQSVGGLNSQRHAGDWLAYQRTVAKRVQSSVFESSGRSLARHPLQLGWFTTQVSICLHLWDHDRSMTEALEVAKMFLLPVDTLTTMFPCQAMEMIRDRLHEHLTKACMYSGLTAPAPPSTSPIQPPYHSIHM
ncbi:hypothetical protein BDM02DRAFT_3086609 [Thelephora ganbajun]|uniref:Uncharacterized protein n=1 Tax=Thelephora ganbajun TaxID=370292 RepID=A0ACB6ZWB4_THEGA|nr:hypothetical protein BDM02DRAFT_3086609 [Thelephora ganbajun]